MITDKIIKITPHPAWATVFTDHVPNAIQFVEKILEKIIQTDYSAHTNDPLSEYGPIGITSSKQNRVKEILVLLKVMNDNPHFKDLPLDEFADLPANYQDIPFSRQSKAITAHILHDLAHQLLDQAHDLLELNPDPSDLDELA